LKRIFAAAFCCLSLVAAHAGSAAPGTAPLPARPAPSADPSFKPSLAVGDSHDCSGYVPPDDAILATGGKPVHLQYDVGADGEISNVKLLQSSGSDLVDEAALTCVRELWRNLPARQYNIPVMTPGHRASILFTPNSSVVTPAPAPAQ
jgi:TonB family protein